MPFDDLDHRLERHGIHKVHAEYAIGSPGDGANPSDRYGRGIGGEDAMLRADRIQARVNLSLYVPLFHDVLDNEASPLKLIVISGEGDAVQHRATLFLRLFAFHEET